MHGRNPIRTPVRGDGSTLDVQEIFPTLQGEGPRAGEPAVFVRLGGCNLTCTFCDTEFESFRPMSVEAVVDTITASAGTRPLVVVTGGEPLRQPIEKLCTLLQKQGFVVQIETNGTLWRPLPAGVEVVCSPKTATGAYAPLRADVLERLTALKFIVSATHPLYRDVGEVGQEGLDIPVYVQPMDEGDARRNADNLAHARAIAEATGYRLSLQLHKILGIP